MKGRHSIILLMALLFNGWVFADSDTLVDGFNRANEDYLNNRFDEAREGYERLIAKPIISGDLLFNLANTYYQLEELGEAILNYERALRVLPRDPGLRANLKFVKKKRIQPIEEIVFWERLLKTLLPWVAFITLNEAIWGMGITLGVVWGLAWFSMVMRGKLWRNLAIAAVGFAILSVATLGLKYYLEVSHWAVVLKPSVEVLSTFVDSSKSLAVLHEGSKVRVIDTQDLNRGVTWFHVLLSPGHTGWIRKGDIEEI